MSWFTVETNHRTMVLQARSIWAATERALNLILAFNGETIHNVKAN